MQNYIYCAKLIESYIGGVEDKFVQPTGQRIPWSFTYITWGISDISIALNPTPNHDVTGLDSGITAYVELTSTWVTTPILNETFPTLVLDSEHCWLLEK